MDNWRSVVHLFTIVHQLCSFQSTTSRVCFHSYSDNALSYVITKHSTWSFRIIRITCASDQFRFIVQPLACWHAALVFIALLDRVIMRYGENDNDKNMYCALHIQEIPSCYGLCCCYKPDWTHYCWIHHIWGSTEAFVRNAVESIFDLSWRNIHSIYISKERRCNYLLHLISTVW